MSEDIKPRKKKGMRKDKRIQLTWTDGKKPDGSPNRVPFYGKTRKEAEEKREAYKREREIGLLAKEKKMTVAEWVDRWSVMYNVNVDDYAPYISRLKNDLGKMRIRNVQEAHLVQTLGAYEGMSTSSATKYRMILKQVFRKAKKNHLIPDDPADDLELPDETSSGSHRALESWESECIMQNWRLHHAGRWAMVMLLCGLRRGEMVALDWDCVDLEKRVLTVRAAARLRGKSVIIKPHTKTEAGMRDLPICEPLYQMFLETPVEKRVGVVCLSAKGKRITSAAIDKGWETFCNYMERVTNGEAAKIRPGRKTKAEIAAAEAEEKRRKETGEKEKERIAFDVLPHDLRHTYATSLYDAGVDVKSAQYYLGHTDVTMTQNLYTHLSEERKNKSRSVLVDYLPD